MNISLGFLLAEYSGIPVGLIVYNTIISQLASADPVLEETRKGSSWHYGLELMQIVSVSTLLYGLSFLGHGGDDLLDRAIVGPLLIALCCFMVEFFTILFVTLKVRLWGKTSRQTKVCTNCLAFLFWIALVTIIITQSGSHPLAIRSTVPVRPSATLMPPGSRRVIFYDVLAGGLIMGLVIVLFLQFRIRRTKKSIIKDYAKGAALINADPTRAIRNFQLSLQKIPATSPMLIDTHMKLARVYSELNQNDKALDQIIRLSKTQAYKDYAYLRTGVLCYQFDLLIKLGQIDEAEELISQITDASIAGKLQLKIYALRKGGEIAPVNRGGQ